MLTTGKTLKKAKKQVERDLIQATLTAFNEATGLVVQMVEFEPRTTNRVMDATFDIQKGNQKWRYLVECKGTLLTNAVGHTATQLQRIDKPTLVVTRYVNPLMADRFKALNVAFMDTAGNAYLNAPGLFVYITGRKLPEPEKGAWKVKLFRPTVLQVVFAILCKPELLQANYREIAKAANVALGTVVWAMYDLRRLGYLVERGKHPRKLVNTHKLLDTWVTAYAQHLRPKLFVGRFRATKVRWWRHRNQWKKFDAFLGGETAAAELTGYLKPEKIVVYKMGDIDHFLTHYRLKKDPDGEVEVLKAFWRFDYRWPYPQLAPPLLIYAELLATAAERNIETGKMIYGQYLARLIKED